MTGHVTKNLFLFFSNSATIYKLARPWHSRESGTLSQIRQLFSTEFKSGRSLSGPLLGWCWTNRCYNCSRYFNGANRAKNTNKSFVRVNHCQIHTLLFCRKTPSIRNLRSLSELYQRAILWGGFTRIKENGSWNAWPKMYDGPNCFSIRVSSRFNFAHGKNKLASVHFPILALPINSNIFLQMPIELFCVSNVVPPLECRVSSKFRSNKRSEREIESFGRSKEIQWLKFQLIVIINSRYDVIITSLLRNGMILGNTTGARSATTHHFYPLHRKFEFLYDWRTDYRIIWKMWRSQESCHGAGQSETS